VSEVSFCERILFGIGETKF